MGTMEHLDQEAPCLASYLHEYQKATAILTNEDSEAPWAESSNVPEYHGEPLNEEMKHLY